MQEQWYASRDLVHVSVDANRIRCEVSERNIMHIVLLSHDSVSDPAPGARGATTLLNQVPDGQGHIPGDV